MDLPRLKPDPIPPIHPLPDYLATGQRKIWYDDMKQVLQVPWMGVVTMAFSHYPNFFETLWSGARPLCVSAPFIDVCAQNRRFAEAEIKSFAPRPLAASLSGLGYAPREIADIRTMIEVFSHGNQPYLMLATLARTLLEGGEMAGSVEPGSAPPHTGRHGIDFDVPFFLMEAHHADPETVARYEDLKTVLGLPFVNTDYRALARWPSYWNVAWADLRQTVVLSEHDALCEALHHKCVAQVQHGLPNPAALVGADLRQAAERDGAAEEILEVCRLFQYLLSGLVVNVAYLRAQLLTGDLGVEQT